MDEVESAVAVRHAEKMRMMNLIVLLAVAAAPLFAADTAGQSASAQVQESPGLEWANAYIPMLLKVYRSAEYRREKAKESSTIGQTEAVLMYQIGLDERTMIDLQAARAGILRFKKSKRKQIAMFADHNCALLDEQAGLLAKARKMAISLHDGRTPYDYDDLMRGIRAKIESNWKRYTTIAAMSVTGAFQTPQGKGEDYETLDFSQEQRDALLREMERLFGDSVKHASPVEGRLSVQLAPAFFYQGLASPDVRFADQPSPL